MAWVGDLLKAGISSDGKNVEIFNGQLSASSAKISGTISGTTLKGGLNTATGLIAAAGNGNNVKVYSYESALAQSAKITLQGASRGFVLAFGGGEGFLGHIKADGSVALIANTTNVSTTSASADCLTLFDDGVSASVRSNITGTNSVKVIGLIV
jgi:hypothetical protein